MDEELFVGVQGNVPLRVRTLVWQRLQSIGRTEGKYAIEVHETYAAEEGKEEGVSSMAAEGRAIALLIVADMVGILTAHTATLTAPTAEIAEEDCRLLEDPEVNIPAPGPSSQKHRGGKKKTPKGDSVQKPGGPYMQITEDVDTTRLDLLIVAVGTFWLKGKDGLILPVMLEEFHALLSEEMAGATGQSRGQGMTSAVHAGWLTCEKVSVGTKRWGLTAKGASRFEEKTGKEVAASTLSDGDGSVKPGRRKRKQQSTKTPAVLDLGDREVIEVEGNDDDLADMTIEELGKVIKPFPKQQQALRELDFKRKMIMASLPPRARKALGHLADHIEAAEEAMYGEE